MKNLLNFKWLLLLLSVFVMVACNRDDDDDVTPEPIPAGESIVDVASANADFSILVSALQRANLVSALEADGPFTVFAPTNAAFEALFATLGVSSVDELPIEVLSPILRYHVLTGEFRAANLQTGEYPTLNNGALLSIEVSGQGVVINGNSNVVTADVEASNGVIHAIDAVLMPSETGEDPLGTIVGVASGAENFSILAEAVVRTGLTDALSATGPFTVFAPNNAAFEALFRNLGVSSVSEIDVETLTPILLYHVIAGSFPASGLASGEYPTLNENANLVISATAGGVTINGEVNVVNADIQASNGIIHEINAVLLPAAGPMTIAALVASDERFSILAQAVERAGLLNVLDDINASFTVFAPTNTAFEAFIAANPNIANVQALLNSPNLSNILLYHVLGSAVPSSVLPTDAPFYQNTLSQTAFEGADGVSLLIDATNGVRLNGTAGIRVTEADLEASNGVVHVIDGVLTPPSIPEMAILNGGFGQLVGALSRADLVNAVSGNGPLTVFAPTDAAFANLYRALGVENVEGIDVETLTSVLLYHVVEGNVRSSDLEDGQVVNTLNPAGATFRVSLAGGRVQLLTAEGTAEVVLTDVQTTNGVIHVISAVILP
ncbi:MAG: fasciclin domain-containing protein [Bernardetiaceae bacterium]|nr:fasciclin domain-containing protein [Bernardetiaceae bacterium]